MFDVDHRQALIHGGDNADDNLAAICDACHRIKTRKDKHGRDHAERIAWGGKQRKGQPMPFGRKSKLKRKMNGDVVWR